MGSITQELHPGERCSCTFLPPDLCQGVNPSDLVAEWLTPRGCLQDFGEYQESYYSVQTTEGEQISQLIAGYIDIILKKVTQTHTGQSCVQGNSTDLWTHTVTSIHHGSLSSHCACDLLSLHTSHLHLHSGSLTDWQCDLFHKQKSIQRFILLLLCKTSFFQELRHKWCVLLLPAEAKQRSLWTGRRWGVNHARGIRIPEKVRG